MPTHTDPTSRRGLRYASYIAPDILEGTRCLIVGVGAIGFALAKLLAQSGVGTLLLVDPDAIDAVNLGPQGWSTGDIGFPKVEAAQRCLALLNPHCQVFTSEEYFRREIPGPDVPSAVFSCVDSMASRREVFDAALSYHRPFFDARMNARQARILTVAPDIVMAGAPLSSLQYHRTLDQGADATVDPCTDRSTGWCAQVAAGFLVSQFIKVLRADPVHGDFTVSMSSCLITTPPPETLDAP